MFSRLASRVGFVSLSQSQFRVLPAILFKSSIDAATNTIKQCSLFSTGNNGIGDQNGESFVKWIASLDIDALKQDLPKFKQESSTLIKMAEQKDETGLLAFISSQTSISDEYLQRKIKSEIIDRYQSQEEKIGINDLTFYEPSSHFVPVNPQNFEIMDREIKKNEVKDIITSNIYGLQHKAPKANIRIIGVAGCAGIGKTAFIQHCMRNDDGGILISDDDGGYKSISLTIDLYNGIGRTIEHLLKNEENASFALGSAVSYSLLKQFDDRYPVFEEWFAGIQQNEFTLSRVVSRIAHCLLEQNPNQKILFNVHLDEIQKPSLNTEGLKNIFRILGSTMEETRVSNKFVFQPFISGTIYDEILKAAEPTYYKFKFVSFPPLSQESAEQLIMDNIPNKLKDGNNQKDIDFLIAASTGFPRIIERMVEMLKNTKTNSIDGQAILSNVSNEMFTEYKSSFVDTRNMDKIDELMENIMMGQPIRDDQFVNDGWDELQKLGVVYLERKKDDTFIPVMPHAFIYQICDYLRSHNQDIGIIMHLMNLNDDWRKWEDIIAAHEVIKNNVFIRSGVENMRISKLMKGAAIFPNDGDDDILIKLEKHEIGRLVHRFPYGFTPEATKKNGEPKNDYDNGPYFDSNLMLNGIKKPMDKLKYLDGTLCDLNTDSLEHDRFYFINGEGSPWFDSFVFYKDVNGRLIIFGVQNKRKQQSEGVQDVYDMKYSFFSEKICEENDVDYKVIYNLFLLSNCDDLKNELNKSLPTGIDVVTVVSPKEFKAYYSPTLYPFIHLLSKTVQK